jgi:hypothetical protein
MRETMRICSAALAASRRPWCPTHVAELTEVVEPVLKDELLEQRPAEIEVHPDVLQDRDLLLEILGDQRGAPPELHEIEELRAAFHYILEIPGGKAAVDHHGDAGRPWLLCSLRKL